MHYNKFFTFVGLLAGLGSGLYLHTPVGILPMFDLAAFVLGPLVCFSVLSTATKEFKNLLLLGILWLCGAIFSDFYRGTPFVVAFKEAMIIVNVLLQILLAGWLLNKSPRFMVFFLVGASIAGVVSLYRFQPGSLYSFAEARGYADKGGMQDFLQEKQYFPAYVGLASTFMTLLPRMVLKKWPWVICYGGKFGAAVLMLFRGGARSQFLTGSIGAILMFLYVHSPKTLMKVFKYKASLFVLLIMGAFTFNAVYMTMAKGGGLGENGLAKYEARQAGASMLDSRTDFFVNWPFLWRSPLVGAGTCCLDPWGYSQMSRFSRELKANEVRTFAGHSTIIGSWTKAGIWGLFFWLYWLHLALKFMGKDMLVLGDLAPFIVSSIVGVCWNLFFSPFGARGWYAVLGAFVALLQNPKYRMWMTMHWNPKLIGRQMFYGRAR